MYADGSCSMFGGDFPWARFSSYNDLRSDWQLGYHLSLIPFCIFGAALGAKLSAVFWAAVLLAVIYDLLRARGVPLAWAFTGLAALAAPLLVFRLHLPRPTTGCVALLLLLVRALAERRPRAVAGWAFASLFFYNVPHNLLLVGAVGLALLWLEDSRPPLRLAGALALGIAAGIVLHPGFWHSDGLLSARRGSVQLWQQLGGTLQASYDGNQVPFEDGWIPMGPPQEFAGLDSRMMRSEFQLPLVLLLASLLLCAWRRPELDSLARLSLALACAYLFLFFDSQRFKEYWVPLACVGAGLVIGAELRLLRFSARKPGPRRWLPWLAALCLFGQALLCWLGSDASWLPSAAAAGCLALDLLPRLQGSRARLLGCLLGLGVLWSGARALQNLQDSWQQWPVSQFNHGDTYAGAARWLQRHSSPGELVFHSQWDDFAPLFFFNQSNHYIVSFDPYFLYQHDPQRYATWLRASFGQLDAQATAQVVRRFGARWVLSTRRPEFGPFLQRMLAAPGIEPVYTDPWCVLFRVRGP